MASLIKYSLLLEFISFFRFMESLFLHYVTFELSELSVFLMYQLLS